MASYPASSHFLDKCLRPMPSDPYEAASWLMPKILKDLADAKLLPLKIGHMKHQDALCTLTICVFKVNK